MAEQNEKSAKTLASDSISRREIQKLMMRQSIRRRLADKIATGLAIACVVAAIIPLGSILMEVVKNGASAMQKTVTEFSTSLDGSQQVPPVSTSATGTGTFQYDHRTHELSSDIAFSGLSSSESAAHILGPTASGSEADILFTLLPGSPKEGKVDLDSLTNRDAAEKDLLAGLWYVNIQSNNYPEGEIRGQISPTKTSTYFNAEFLTQPPGSLGSGEGGIAQAIQGTLIVVGLASLIGAPVGVLAGIYLSEFAGTGKFPYAVRFLNDVLTGLPSIIVGIVAFVAIVLTIGSFSVWAGAFALSIIMIPVVVRVTEETLKIVPNSIREAGYSLGIPKWRVVLSIVLTTAKSGVLTGIVLAISRIAGETAPLIMTVLGTSLFFTGFAQPVDALPLRIWRLASQPYPSAHESGWGAALILILMVLAMSVGLRMLAYKRGFKIKSAAF